MSEMHIDEFDSLFLVLSLEIDKHINGYVDSYYGPDQIKEQVEMAPPLSPDQLFEKYKYLKDIIPTDSANRFKYLSATLKAMECTIRKLRGKEYDYLEEINHLFGVSPKIIDEGIYKNIHRHLDSMLPGPGLLTDRVQTYMEKIVIPGNKIPKAVDMIIGEIRDRARKYFRYEPNESVEFKFVRQKPWAMEAHYLGDAHTVIRINLDVDWNPFQLAKILIHESYPGHHTEYQTKQRCLYSEKGYVEESCMILLSPSSVITEGIADTAIEIISPQMDIYQWIAKVLTPELGLPNDFPGELFFKDKFSPVLRSCCSNAAILYHSGQIKEDEAIDYICNFFLANRKLVKQLFSMTQDPLYKTYVVIYAEGYRFIDQAAAGQNKLPLFQKLISEQVLPDDLISTA